MLAEDEEVGVAAADFVAEGGNRDAVGYVVLGEDTTVFYQCLTNLNIKFFEVQRCGFFL